IQATMTVFHGKMRVTFFLLASYLLVFFWKTCSITNRGNSQFPEINYLHLSYQDRPACPRRLVRNCSAMSGANRLSHSRTASYVNTRPLSRNISARSRKLNAYRSRHTTTRRTISVGYSRELNGVPLRSLNVCLQVE